MQSQIQTDNLRESLDGWIGAGEIVLIQGALRPASYTARAYQYSRKHKGSLPEWARKGRDGRWEFLKAYIMDDAGRDARTISISEAAELLGATKRTVQKWVDSGLIKAERDSRGKGGERRIIKDMFTIQVNSLKHRLENAAVVRFKQERGHEIPEDLIRRVGEEMKTIRRSARDRINARRRAKRAESRRLERSETLEDRYRRIQAVRLVAERERDRVGSELKALKDDEMRLKAELKQALAGARAELKSVEKDLRDATRARRSAERKAKAKKELAGQLLEKEGKLLQEKFRVESELKIIKDAGASGRASRPESVPSSGGSRDDGVRMGASRGSREEKLAQIEERLKLAREKKQEMDRMEKKAGLLASKVLNDIFDGTIGHPDGVALFEKLAGEQGIPEDIRARIRKKHFG